ncbi:MAG: hypothetical protein QE279_00355 [Rhodoferax sp.]|nr:hypothetical protein [Rhodoferax sp.]
MLKAGAGANNRHNLVLRHRLAHRFARHFAACLTRYRRALTFQGKQGLTVPNQLPTLGRVRQVKRMGALRLVMRAATLQTLQSPAPWLAIRRPLRSLKRSASQHAARFACDLHGRCRCGGQVARGWQLGAAPRPCRQRAGDVAVHGTGQRVFAAATALGG